MFGKKSFSQPALVEAQGAALSLGPLAHPQIATAGAGFAFLVAAALLIAVVGDPHAGTPRVRVPLADVKAAPVTLPSSSAAPAMPGMSDAAVSDTTAAPGTLTQAPIAGLFQPSPVGPLPVIAPDGRTPAQAYARPFTDLGKPKVALVIGGLGLNATATRQAIEQLPADVTLSFVPYAEGLQGWIDLARANGHEVLLETPMEPVDYPQNDPGPYTLMASDNAQATTKRLEWLLGRASGYFGLTNYLGGRFLANDAAVSSFTGALRQRGLAFIDDGSARGRGAGIPRASAERIIDGDLDGGSIKAQLATLEASARQRGAALGSGFAYPVTLEEAKAWAEGLSQRGLQLAPASAVMVAR
jgi:polysaccharide deacetylase 2 family uncharacterized protein YibQ